MSAERITGKFTMGIARGIAKRFARLSQQYQRAQKHSERVFVCGFWVMVALSCALSLVLLQAALCVRPMLDDYYWLNETRSGPSLGMVAHLYQDWSGRFAYVWFMGALLRLGQGDLGRLIFALLGAGVGIGCWSLARRDTLTVTVAALGAALISAVVLTPSPAQALFWFSASANILPPLILLPLLLALRRISSRWGALAGLALGFVIAGFHEQAACVAAAVAGGLVARDAWRRHFHFASCGAFLGVVLGALTMLAAPGNRVRAAATAGHLRSGRALEVGYQAAQDLFWNAVPRPGLYFPSLLDVPHPYLLWPAVSVLWLAILTAYCGQKLRPAARIQPHQVVGAVLCGWALCTGIFLLTSWTLRQILISYERVFFVPAFVVALTGALLGYTLRPLIARPPLWLGALLWLSLAASGATIRSLFGLSGEMNRFGAAWDAQNARLLAAGKNGGRDVVMPAIARPGVPLRMWSADPKDHYNRDVAQYYGFRSLKAPEAE